MSKDKTSIMESFPRGYSPRPNQVAVLSAVEKHWDDADVFVIDAAVGCHTLGTKILMYDRTIRNVEDVKIGDLLLGDDGLPRKVLRLFQGRQECFEIIPFSGQRFECNLDHILSLRKTTLRSKHKLPNRRKDFKGNNNIVNISVRDWLSASSNFKRNHYLYRVPIQGGITLPENVIDPYILGTWLGDGNSGHSTITSADQEVLDAWKVWADKIQAKVSIRTDKNVHKLSILGRPNKAINLLKGLLNNKHIPQVYLNSTREERLQLLAGLLDTDGSLSKSNTFDFIQKNERLCKQVAWLARSLGFRAHLSSCKKSCQTGAIGDYWRLCISGDCSIIPTRLPRKQAAVRRQKKSVLMDGIKEIRSLGEKEYYGFELDGNNLYLLEDFTVTHNSGKSHMAATIGMYSWKKYGTKAMLCVPNNILLKQYQESFPLIASVSKQSSYSCTKYKDQPQKLNCKKSKALQGSFCKDCPYLKDLRKTQAMPLSISNYHSYMAYKMYRPTVLFDESHNLINTISGLAAAKLWHHDYHYPSSVSDYRSLWAWATKEITKDIPLAKANKLQKLLEELEANKTTRVYTKGTALYRFEEKDCILAQPVDISNEPPIFWPNKVRKLFMLSATFNSRDIKELGLRNRRVAYVPSPHVIPKERRPWRVEPTLNLSYSSQHTSVPKLAMRIAQILAMRPSKGFIHAPYALAAKLESELNKLDLPPSIAERLIFHKASDKMKQYAKFKELPGGVMIASGMYEGISLDEDLARWQIICKVPWPSLAEPAMEYLAKEDSEYYANRTIKDIVQTYGRVCRGPEDYGETIILDNSFIRLYKQYNHLFPRWFIEAEDVS